MGIALTVPKLGRLGQKRQEYLVCADVSNGREPRKVPALSYKKDDKPPLDFHYVTEFIQTEPIGLDSSLKMMSICDCSLDCHEKQCACSFSENLGTSIYNQKGRLRGRFLDAPELIRECNVGCGCNPRTCKNRVIQAGPQKQFVIYRTKKRGWGVRPLEALHRGTFIGVYSGELISVDESHNRKDDTYLFNLARSWQTKQEQREAEQQQQEVEENLGSLFEDGQRIEPERGLKCETAGQIYHDDQESARESADDIIEVNELIEILSQSESEPESQLELLSSASLHHEPSGASYEKLQIDEQQSALIEHDTVSSGCNLIEEEHSFADVNQEASSKCECSGTVPADREECFVCDAKFYGNFTRFINHSCEPNVVGIRALTTHQDNRFPYIAFFALKDIDANEELTLNYGDNYWIVKARRDGIHCLCKTTSCRFAK